MGHHKLRKLPLCCNRRGCGRILRGGEIAGDCVLGADAVDYDFKQEGIFAAEELERFVEALVLFCVDLVIGVDGEGEAAFLGVRFLQLQADSTHWNFSAFYEREGVVVAIALVLENFQLVGIARNQGAVSVQIALHGCQLGVGVGQISFDAADIRLDVGHVTGNRCDLPLRPFLLVCQTRSAGLEFSRPCIQLLLGEAQRVLQLVRSHIQLCGSFLLRRRKLGVLGREIADRLLLCSNFAIQSGAPDDSTQA